MDVVRTFKNERIDMELVRLSKAHKHEAQLNIFVSDGARMGRPGERCCVGSTNHRSLAGAHQSFDELKRGAERGII